VKQTGHGKSATIDLFQNAANLIAAGGRHLEDVGFELAILRPGKHEDALIATGRERRGHLLPDPSVIC
jgi:hypothetical protein